MARAVTDSVAQMDSVRKLDGPHPSLGPEMCCTALSSEHTENTRL